MMNTEYDMVYDNEHKTTLIGIVFRYLGFEDGKAIPFTPTNEPLAAEALSLDEDDGIGPFKAFCMHAGTNKPECWVVIDGLAKAIFYGFRGEIVAERILEPGDMCVVLRGERELRALEDKTRLYSIRFGSSLHLTFDNIHIAGETDETT